jgi:hypothetical protein
MSATDQMLRIDLRRRRAEVLCHGVMQAIDPYLDRDASRRDIYEALMKLFHQEGVEVLSDYDRQQYGLPPRGPDGWTVEEIVALEEKRLEMLRRPLTMTVPVK